MHMRFYWANISFAITSVCLERKSHSWVQYLFPGC
jgi:hypothetical protein